MPPAGESGDRLFETRWVHVFEEDTAEGAVYRPDDADIPLSRRPRSQIELAPDGSARLFLADRGDRLVGKPASWYEDAEAPVSGAEAGARICLVRRAPGRIVVRIAGSPPVR